MKTPRVLWLVGLLALPVSFALLLTIAAKSDPRVWVQFDLDGTRRDMDEGFVFALILGTPFEFVLSLILSGLTWIVVERPIRFWRPVTFCLSAAGSGVLLLSLSKYWLYEDMALAPTKAYPVYVAAVVFFGLPLLWTLALVFFTVVVRERKGWEGEFV